MTFTKEHKILMKVLRQERGYGAKRFVKKFLNKNWSLSSLNKLLKKTDQTVELSNVNQTQEKRVRRALRNTGNVLYV